MSHQSTSLAAKPLSIPEITARKGGEKLVLLTAYSAPMAELLAPHCDMLMVGDSLGMVVYGMDSTLPVTLEMMINHGAAVVRKAKSVSVVVDLPFGSYQASPEQAFRNAARVLKETGASAVKMEGGVEMAETVRYLAQRGIPVMGHVGLMPQHVNRYGGFKAQGRDAEARKSMMADVKAIAEAGAEDDMLGMFDFGAKFVKKYANIREVISSAAASYAAEVKSGAFPTAEHCYGTGPKKVTA